MGESCKYYYASEQHYNAHILNMLEGRSGPLFHQHAFGQKKCFQKNLTLAMRVFTEALDSLVTLLALHALKIYTYLGAPLAYRRPFLKS